MESRDKGQRQICQKIQEHTFLARAPLRRIFRLPILIILLHSAQINIRTLFQARLTNSDSTGHVNATLARGQNTYLESLLSSCEEYQWAVYVAFVAFPNFVTMVAPTQFAMMIVVPLVHVFQEFYAEFAQAQDDCESDGRVSA